MPREADSPPLVSVIVPAYNAAENISHTIRSVQAQTHQNWEMLITDDGSEDETAAIVERHAADDPRIRLLRFEKNTGLAAKARNHSMKASQGDFIAFLDADDEWRPDKLEKQLAYLKRHPEADALCTWYYVFGDLERAALYNSMMWRFSGQVVTLEEILQQSLNTCTVMMRRKCLKKIGGMDESQALRSGQDYEYFIRLVANCTMHRLTEETTGYRLASLGGSLSTVGQNAKKRFQREKNLLRVLKRKKVLKPKYLKMREAIMYYNLARDKLFILRLPFRRDLYRSVSTNAAPPKAKLMFALSFLPAPVLRTVLTGLLKLRNGIGKLALDLLPAKVAGSRN